MRRALLLIGSFLWAQDLYQPVPYTLADRERLVRLEEKVNALEKRIDQLEKRIDRIEARLDRLEERLDRVEARISAVETRLDNQFSQLTYLLFAIMGLIVGLMGFILWDRQKTFKPLEQKIKTLQEDTEKLTRLVASLQEYARMHPDMGEILRRYGLL